jgi:CRP-like cAMP-binding protein
MSWLTDSLPDADRAAAAAILERCPSLLLREGAAYSAARLPASALLLVEDGLALVRRVRPGATRRMVLTVAGPGSILPELGADDRLEVVERMGVTALPPAARDALLRLPTAASLLVETLAEELRESHETIGQFASVRHVERVREKLLQLARIHGRVVPGGVRLDLPLTHELVGEMIGSARETVTWAMGQLAREGFVQREGRTYRLSVPPEALAS